MPTTPIAVLPLFYDRTGFDLLLLFFDVSLALISNFIIVTQSKTLGTFKYYLLNQNIMGCFTSMVVIVGNPVFLPPHYCLFTGGLFRKIENNNIILIMAILFIFCALYTINMILLSIVNRFVHVFHHQYRYLFDNKHIFVVNFAFSVIVCFLISFGMRSVYNTSHEKIVAIAENEAHGAIKNYYSESTLFCFTKIDTMASTIITGTTILITLFTTVLVFMTSWFVYSVRNTKTVILSKLSRSLYISTVCQTLLLVIIIFLPLTVAAYIFLLEIPNLSNFVNVLVFCGSIHGTIDSLSIMFFIAPYRKYCSTFFQTKKTRDFVNKMTS